MENTSQPKYKRIFFLGIILIALGVTFSTTMREDIGSLGVVFIALGGLFFISAMARKRKEEEKIKSNKKQTE